MPRSPGRWGGTLGRNRHEKSSKYCVASRKAATVTKQFFLLIIGRDIEPQIKLGQKNHSSLEINSSKVGGIGKKWCKTLPKYTTSIGFLLKSEKLMNFINFLTFNGNPMEVEHFGRVLHHFLPMPDFG